MPTRRPAQKRGGSRSPDARPLKRSCNAQSRVSDQETWAWNSQADTIHGKQKRKDASPEGSCAESSGDDDDGDYVSPDAQPSEQEGRSVEPAEITEDADVAPVDPRTPPFPFNRDRSAGALTCPVLEVLPASLGEFRWSDGRHRCTHASSAGAVDPLSVADRSCAVLSFLEGIFFVPRCRFFVCRRCACVVGQGELARHVEKHHAGALSALKKSPGLNWPKALAHIEAAFSPYHPLLGDAAIIAHVHSLEVPEPIPGLAVEPCSQCGGCSGWFSRRSREKPGRALGAHCNAHPGSKCKVWLDGQEALGTHRQPARHAIQLWTTNNASRRICLPVTFVPTPTRDPSLAPVAQPGKPMPVPHTSTSPAYVKQFGWLQHVAEMKTKRENLLALTAMPSARMVALWPKGSVGAAVEAGLCVLTGFICVYLREANTVVNGSSPEFRDTLVSG